MCAPLYHRVCGFAFGLFAIALMTCMAEAGGGRGIPVADLRFTVSDPMPPAGTSAGTFTPPSCLDANGLVAGKLFTSVDVPILWDSNTGVVHDLLPSAGSPAGYAKSVNGRGNIGGQAWQSDIFLPWLWDASVYPVTSLGPMIPHINRFVSLSDSNNRVMQKDPNSATPEGLQTCIITGDGTVHYFVGGLVDQPFDINDRGRMVFFRIIGVPQPMLVDPPYDMASEAQLPYPTEAELGFPPTTAAPYAINRYDEIVGLVEGLRLVRWNADGSYDVLDTTSYDRMDIADNGIILWKFGNAIVLYDPDTLAKTTLDSLVDPAGNPLNFIFTDGGSHIGGIDSNAAVTRIVALGFSLTLGAPRWVVLTAVTPGLTDGADFEAGTLSPFDVGGSGDAVIVDDPYELGNHVLQMEGTVSVRQPVSTPTKAFAIGFRADVPSPGGASEQTLEVSLDGTIIGTFTGEQLTNGALTSQLAVVTDSLLMNQVGISLKFEWDDPNAAFGPATSALIIDDIVFTEAPVPCPADITPGSGDGVVNIDDLLTVINNWGAVGSNPADVTGDGSVNIDDLLAVINNWGPCG